MFLYQYIFFKRHVTTHRSTLSLHDALPISRGSTESRPTRKLAVYELPLPEGEGWGDGQLDERTKLIRWRAQIVDRKSTRLNSSHLVKSYAVFCFKKKFKYGINTS